MIANVNDRHSIMAVYPLESFEMDADQNSMANETSRHGLLIETTRSRWIIPLSTCDKVDWRSARGTALVVHLSLHGQGIRMFAMLGGAVGGVEEKLNHIIDTQLHEYDVFIDAVIAAPQGFTPLGPPHTPTLG